MKLSTILLIAAAVIVALIIVIFLFFAPSASAHSLVYEGKELYRSKDPIIVSCDRVDTIVYSTDNGIVQYDIGTGGKTVINASTEVKGIAYVEGGFLMLDKAGTFIRLSDGTSLNMGGEALYDTVGGYYEKVAGVDSDTGNGTPANGKYGLIKLTVK